MIEEALALESLKEVETKKISRAFEWRPSKSQTSASPTQKGTSFAGKGIS